MDALLNNYLGTTQLSASLIIPVVTVLVGAVLVFVCGFRKPKEPQFRKIAASVESGSKKTNRKDKAPTNTSTKGKIQNGSAKQAQQVAAAAGNKKQSAPPAKKEKESQQSPAAASKRKEPAAPKKAPAKTNTSEKVTSKKSQSSKADKGPKPADFDDGGWTTVPSRTDKKKKQDDQLATQGTDAASPQAGKKTAGANKTDTKSTKNAKQLKDQANKSKKEAAESNKKNKGNAADNEQVNNKVADKIESLVNELKDNDNFGKQSKIIDSTDHGSTEEKSDDSKPVSGVVFNEMADTWTEAKAPKKGKKKARKD